MRTEPRTLSTMRVGALLTSTRTATGRPIDEIARRSNGGFTPAELRTIEAGDLPLDEHTVATLIDLYQVEPTPTEADDDHLIIDLVDEEIRIGSHALDLRSPAVEEILDRYVNLVGIVRGGSPLASAARLRGEDRTVLCQVLGIDSTELAARIDRTTPPRSVPAVSVLLPLLLAGSLALALVLGGVVLWLADNPSATGSVVGGDAASAQASADAAGLTTTLAAQPAPPIRAAVGEAPAAASSPTIADPAGDQVSAIALTPRQAAIEESIPWDFRRELPGWQIIHAGPHPQWRGVANSIERSITLFDRSDTTIASAAAVLAHELGHAVDLDVLDGSRRAEWLELRGIDGPWWAESGQADFDTGAGDFAEAVAVYLLDHESRSPFGPLTGEQVRFVADAIPGV
ncbi:MAG: hypothetical protein AAF567_21475 [Actinomycetota bacterium]